jgi:hypothetical protein
VAAGLTACAETLPELAAAPASIAKLRVQVVEQVQVTNYKTAGQAGSNIDPLDNAQGRKFGAVLRAALQQSLAKAGFNVVAPDEPHDVTASISAVDAFRQGVLRSDTCATVGVWLHHGSTLVGEAVPVFHCNLEESAQFVAIQLVDGLESSAPLARFAATYRGSDASTAVVSVRVAPAVLAVSPPAAPPSAPAAVPPSSPFLVGASQPNAFALVIGIEKYRDLPSPTGARGDAEQFAELARKTLGIRPENVRLALDDHASKADIESQLAWLKGNVPPGGRVYFFYSGHGAPDASQGTPYLLPYDGNPSSVSTTALALVDVMKALGETKATDVLAIVDSCFSGAGGRSVLPAGARPLVHVNATAPTARVALFAASSGSEISGPSADGTSGLFTRTVTQALGTGQADTDGDGQVSLEELANWVRPRVVREAKRASRDQTPSVTVGSGVSAGSFIVAGGFVR